jgi:hypothetical protein
MLRSGLASSGSIGAGAARLLFILLSRLVGRSLGNGLSILLVFVDSPVENVIILKTLADEKITEDLAKVGVIRLVIETKGSSIVKINGEFVRESTAEDLGGSGHLLLHDTVILLLLGGSLETLPWERTSTEVEHDVSKGFHIVTARLLWRTVSVQTWDEEWIRLTNAQVSIDGSIPSSTGQVLILTVWDVEVSLRVTIFLSKTEINDVDLVTTLANTHKEVVRLDITMDEGLGMNVLNARDELIGQQQHRLQWKLPVAEVEEILQAGSKEIKNHGIVITFGSKPADKRDSNTTSEGLVDTCLVFELRVLGLDTLKLNGNLLTGDDVGSKIDVTETATPNLSADAVLVTYA